MIGWDYGKCVLFILKVTTMAKRWRSDGEAIWILDEAAELEMQVMPIEASDTVFATGGQDSLLKVWHYDNGEVVGVGKGHSEAINAVNKNFPLMIF